jgi:hypothetical protein
MTHPEKTPRPFDKNEMDWLYGEWSWSFASQEYNSQKSWLQIY